MELVDAAGVDCPSVSVPAMLFTTERPVVPREISPVRLRLKVWPLALAAPSPPFNVMPLETVRSPPRGTIGGGDAEVLVMVIVPVPNGPDVIAPYSPLVLTPSWTAPVPLVPICEPPV